MDKWIRNAVTNLRHRLHQAAELSGKETVTKQILMDFIKENTDFEVVDRGSWFYVHACMGTGDGKIAFRADMDALPMDDTFTMEELPWRSVTPGVSHKCGHDGHSACLAGLAMMLWQDKEDMQGSCGESVCLDLNGDSESACPSKKHYSDIYLIFQHAEEIGAGGEECSKLIEEKHIDEVYAFHNWSGFPEGAVKVSDSLSQCASQGLLIRYEGVRTHASEPEHGLNPTTAIAKLAIKVEEIAAMKDYKALTMATIVGMNTGSMNFGMAAADGYLAITLRASLDDDLAILKKRILEAAEELAFPKFTFSVEEFDIFPATVNSPEAAERVRQAAQKKRCNLVPMETPYRASEDFGWYLQKAPGAIFYVGNGEEYPPIHTDRYDFNDQIIPVVCDIFYNLCH